VIVGPGREDAIEQRPERIARVSRENRDANARFFARSRLFSGWHHQPNLPLTLSIDPIERNRTPLCRLFSTAELQRSDCRSEGCWVRCKAASRFGLILNDDSHSKPHNQTFTCRRGDRGPALSPLKASREASLLGRYGATLCPSTRTKTGARTSALWPV
jgi:hypothetical protein